MPDIHQSEQQCAALTGGIATGKSTVAVLLKELGAHIVDTDQLARKVVEPGKPALDAIIREFGREVIDADGTLNRQKVRDVMIRDAAMRRKLNEITHPEIMKASLEEITSYQRLNDGMPVIIDVPLLFEVGWNKFFPVVVLVYVPVQIQIARLMARDKLTRETAELTIKAQMGIEDKKRLSQYIIDNSDTIESTKIHVIEVFHRIQRVL